MVSQRQSPNYPYPDGTVHYILMSCVPDTNLNDIYEDLQPWQLGSIRRQLTTTLEYMRLREFVLSEQHPSFLRYDEKNDKLYIVDYSFMDFTDPNGPFSRAINGDSPFVTAFGIWGWDPPSVFSGSNIAASRPNGSRQLARHSSGPERGIGLPPQSASRSSGQSGVPKQGRSRPGSGQEEKIQLAENSSTK